VTLVEDLIATAGVVCPTEKVVVTNFIQRGGGRVGRNVAAHSNPGTLSPVHGHRCVPADPGAVPTLQLLVTRELRFRFGRNGVEVVRGGDHRDAKVKFFGSLEEAQHDFATTLVTGTSNDGIERLLPLCGLYGVRVHPVRRIGVLVVDRHPDLFLCVVDPEVVFPGGLLREIPFSLDLDAARAGGGQGCAVV
jgi:hypothetical protein